MCGECVDMRLAMSKINRNGPYSSRYLDVGFGSHDCLAISVVLPLATYNGTTTVVVI